MRRLLPNLFYSGTDSDCYAGTFCLLNKREMSERKEIEELVKKTEGNSDNPSGLLQSYMDYAELCSDPTEVYQYMEDKQICVALPSFWR